MTMTYQEAMKQLNEPPRTPAAKPGRPTDSELNRRGRTRKQLKHLAQLRKEKQNPRLFE